MEHTKEPWISDGTLVFMGNNEGGFDIRNCPEPEANARRIVACVNACAEISTATLEQVGLDVGNELVKLKQQRDELKETLDVAIAAAQKAEKELIECMRQRDELLAALEFYTNPNVYEPDSIGRRDDITFVARAAIAKVKP